MCVDNVQLRGRPILVNLGYLGIPWDTLSILVPSKEDPWGARGSLSLSSHPSWASPWMYQGFGQRDGHATGLGGFHWGSDALH